MDRSPALDTATRRLPLSAFLLLLAVLLAALVPQRGSRPLSGDGLEYALMTIALAERGSATITSADVDLARHVLPPDFAGSLDGLAAALAQRQPLPPGFHAGRTGVQAIHFFGYAALAVPPYRLLEAAGLPPLSCFLVLNLIFVWLLGWAAWEYLGGAVPGLIAVALFLCCGGILYWDWSGPDCVTAAALLAALLWFASGRLIAAGLILGMAAMQNPGLTLLTGWMPLLLLCLHYRRGHHRAAQWREVVTPRLLGALLLAVALAITAPLYNLWQFGVPSLIARLSTDPGLASPARLFSLYFDLDQGMILALPALAPVLLVLAFVGDTGALARYRMVLFACITGSVIAVLPTLVVHNWNAGGNGVMRYALWGSMPLLFAFLWWLRRQRTPRWPLLALLLATQAGAMHAIAGASYVEFTPLARSVLNVAPQWYNPEPEIFHERVTHVESYPGPEKVFQYAPDGHVIKTMYHERHPDIDRVLCPPGQRLADDLSRTDADRGWHYINGPIRCTHQ